MGGRGSSLGGAGGGAAPVAITPAAPASYGALTEKLADGTLVYNNASYEIKGDEAVDFLQGTHAYDVRQAAADQNGGTVNSYKFDAYRETLLKEGKGNDFGEPGSLGQISYRMQLVANKVVVSKGKAEYSRIKYTVYPVGFRAY